MGSALQYRIAGPNDAAALAALRWALKTDDGAHVPEEPKAGFVDRYKASVFQTDPAARHVIASLGSDIVGVMTLRRVDKEMSPDRPSSAFGYLTNCYLQPEYRNQGYGSALLTAVIDTARADEFQFLIVWPSERSVPFYRRAGFAGMGEPLTLDLTTN